MKDFYKFTIEAGVVTAVYELEDGSWKLKPIESGVTYALADPADLTVVIRTKLEDGAPEIDRYVSGDGGLTYLESDSESEDQNSESEDDRYRFQFDALGKVISVAKFEDGAWKPERIDANESFRLDPDLGIARVIKLEAEHDGTKTEVYEDLDGDGIYVELGSAGESDNDVYVGGLLADTARGGLGADEIYGNGGHDDLSGDEGDDDLFGDDGDDELSGGDDNDELYGGKGNDQISGDNGNDDLNGDDGNDSLNGGDGDDDINGGNGKDRVVGGRGRDVLSGGLLSDTFVYGSRQESAAGGLRDVITDFSASQRDILNLTGIDANAKLAGNQAFSWLGSRGFSGVSGQLRYYSNAPLSVVVQGDVDGDRKADLEIELHGVSALLRSQVAL